MRTVGKFILTGIVFFFSQLIISAELQEITPRQRLELISKIKALVEEGKDINAKDEEGHTALYLATYAEDIRTVKLLLQNKVNPNLADNDGYTPLHIAGLTGNVEIATLLIDHSAEINCACKEGRTPLFLAARENRQEMVRYLLITGADPYKAKQGGWTPMHTAAGQGSVEALDVFVERGVPLDVRNEKNGWTSLHLAAEKNRLEVCQYLMSHGADVNAWTSCHCTPLLYAAENASLAVIKQLVDKGADICVYSCQGYTSLLLAVSDNEPDVVEFLLSKGADINAMTPGGLNVLDIAMSRYYDEMDETDTRLDEDRNALTPQEMDILNAAAAKAFNDPNVMQLLSSAGQGANAMTSDAVDDLIFRIISQNVQDPNILKFLSNERARKNAPEPDMSNISRPIVSTKKLKMLRVLLDHGFDINSANGNGYPTITYALRKYSKGDVEEETIRQLMDWGADPNIPDLEYNEYPLNYARESKDKAIISLLEKYQAVDEPENLYHFSLIPKELITVEEEEPGIQSYNAPTSQLNAFLDKYLDGGGDWRATDEVGNTFLHWAAECGQKQRVEQLMAKGMNVDVRSRTWRTPLHHVVLGIGGNKDVVKLLLDKGADIEARDIMGNTPLHLAAKESDTVVGDLLANKANPNAQNRYGMTPLHYLCAVSSSNAGGLIKVLLNAGADIQLRDWRGETPLHVLCRHNTGMNEMVMLMIECGADVNLPNAMGNCPLHLISSEDDLVQILIEKKADLEVRDSLGLTPLARAAMEGNGKIVGQLLKAGAKMDVLSYGHGRTPLHLAATNGRTAIVQQLLKKGADASVRDRDGDTPLDLAKQEKHTEVVALLSRATQTQSDDYDATKAEAEKQKRRHERKKTQRTAWLNENPGPVIKAVLESDPNALIRLAEQKADFNEYMDAFGGKYSALHVAVYLEDKAMVRLLVKLGVDVDIPRGDGCSSLYLAAMDGSLVMTQLLAELGADMECQIQGKTPFQVALLCKNEPMIRFYLSKGVSVNVPDESGNTLLHKASSSNGLVKLLLELGADVNARNEEGKTPLHLCACGDAKKENLELLIDAGADINALSNHGHTPLFYAAACGSTEIVMFLLDKGADVNLRQISENDVVKPTQEDFMPQAMRSMEMMPSARNMFSREKMEEKAREAADKMAKSASLSVKRTLVNGQVTVAGQSPIFAAKGNKEMVTLLLEHGADCMLKDAVGQTVLQYIAGGVEVGVNDLEIVELYIDKGVPINEMDINGETALYKAIKARRSDIVKLLLDKGADINIRGSFDETMQEACILRGPECMESLKLLLDKGAEVDVKSKAGYTLLWMACQNSEKEFAELLIEHGADVEAKNPSGTSLLWFACLNNETELVKFLIKHGAKTDVRNGQGVALKEFLERTHRLGLLELIQQTQAERQQ